MTPELAFGDLSGKGIIAVLFIIGIVLISTNIATGLGTLALTSAVVIGIIVGGLAIASAIMGIIKH